MARGIQLTLKIHDCTQNFAYSKRQFEEASTTNSHNRTNLYLVFSYILVSSYTFLCLLLTLLFTFVIALMIVTANI